MSRAFEVEASLGGCAEREGHAAVLDAGCWVLNGGAKVEIESLEVMESALERRQLRFVLAWAELHQDELLANWRRARAGETLEDIEPLR